MDEPKSRFPAPFQGARRGFIRCSLRRLRVSPTSGMFEWHPLDQGAGESIIPLSPQAERKRKQALRAPGSSRPGHPHFKEAWLLNLTKRSTGSPVGLESGLQDKPSAAAGRRKKKIIITSRRMGTHTAAGDEPLTSKLHTHCRYRHRPRQHLDPSSLPGCGSGSDPGGVGGCGDTDGSPQPWCHRG